MVWGLNEWNLWQCSAEAHPPKNPVFLLIRKKLWDRFSCPGESSQIQINLFTLEFVGLLLTSTAYIQLWFGNPFKYYSMTMALKKPINAE